MRTNPILPPLVLREYYGKTNFQPNIQPNIATIIPASIAGHHRKPPPLSLRTQPSLPLSFRTQRPFPLSFPTQPPPSCHSEQPHSVILSEVPSSLAILSAAPSSSVIPNTAPFPLCHSERSAALLPVIPNTVRNLNSLHTHHSQTSHSSSHSKRHVPNSAIPNAATSILSFRTQRPFPLVILNVAQHPFCHSEHSEESKLTAPPPSTDLRFLASLETTRPKFCHSERSIPSLPSRTAPSPVIPNSSPFRHPEHSALSPLSF